MAFEVSLRLVIRNRHDFSEIKFDRKILLDWKVVHLSLVCDSCVILLSWNSVKRLKSLLIFHKSTLNVSSWKLRWQHVWLAQRLILSSPLGRWIFGKLLPVWRVSLLNELHVNLVKFVQISLFSFDPILNLSQICRSRRPHQWRLLNSWLVEHIPFARIRHRPFHLSHRQLPRRMPRLLLNRVHLYRIIKSINLGVALHDLWLVFLGVLRGMLGELYCRHD